MNFHSDEWIMNKMQSHYNDACKKYPEYRIVGVFYQGSGNYGLDYEGSDVDTKCVLAPSLKELAESKMTSTTYVRENDEHIDFKDVRAMLETFRKSNLNFLEILYTKYYIINPIYEAEWNKLIAARDSIVAMNLPSLLKSMKGIASEKFHALEHNKLAKHMMHLVRLYLMCFDILNNGEIVTYREKDHDFLMEIRNGKYLDENKQPIPEFFKLVDELEAKFDMAKETTSLPDNPDYKKINEFVASVNERVVKGQI